MKMELLVPVEATKDWKRHVRDIQGMIKVALAQEVPFQIILSDLLDTVDALERNYLDNPVKP